MTTAQQAPLPFDATEKALLSRTTPPIIAPVPTSATGSAVREPMLLTVRDVEAELQLGRTRTYELLRSGELPVIRLGRALRVPRHALRRWIDSQTV